MSVSIVIPTHNGLELLKKILPSILDLIKNVEDNEIFVVDDGSGDRTSDYLKGYSSQIKVIVLKKNVGFGSACNTGVSQARNSLVLLLNNDVLINSDFLTPALSTFRKQEKKGQNIFALACRVLKGDQKTYYHFRNEGIFSKGEIIIKPVSDEKGSTFFASGVMMLFSKEVFMELGGFDDLYHPFYWEDVDICYRALKKGYRIIYNPKIVIYHKDQSTTVFSKKGKFPLFFAKMYARIIQERNQYLFTWKNILDHGLILKHITWIPIQLLLSLKNKDHIFKSIGLIFALMKLKKALKKRKKESEMEYQFNDRQILRIRSE